MVNQRGIEANPENINVLFDMSSPYKPMEVMILVERVVALSRRSCIKEVMSLGEMFVALRRYKIKLNPLKCNFSVGSGKFLRFMVNQRGIQTNPEKIKALLNMSSPHKPKEVMSLARRATTLSRFVWRATDKYVPFFDVLKGSRNSNG